MLDNSMVRSLADRLQVGASDGHGVQVELAGCLVPMIRCALRAGVGAPQVVAWVHAHAAGQLREGPPEELAEALARELSSAVVRRWCEGGCESLRAEETVRVNNAGT
jgi:hypothetical protein